VLQAVLDAYQGTILLVTHDRYLVDALASQIWEIDPDESHLTVFSGTYSQLKEEREKQARGEAERQAAADGVKRLIPRRTKDTGAKEERRRVAQLQEIENAIAKLEQQLGDLATLLEHPPTDPVEVRRLGNEYTRLQDEMDSKLGEWEKLGPG
jgi:ATP-binding cassette subfamily F protein 3